MIHSGLVSVTFRKLSPENIVALAARAGLEGIEWGGDIHVPHGDLDAARRVQWMTTDAGLKVASYGSYYRAGPAEPCPFEAVVETALALGAPNVRVWAGKKGSAEASAADRDLVVQDSRRIADLAAQAGLSVAHEFHGGTLTDTAASARRLMEAVAHANLRAYWQPRPELPLDENLAVIAALTPWLSNVHVFHWQAGARLPLAGGEDSWQRYLKTIAVLGGERYAMLEFVRDDAPEQLEQDASTLERWLAHIPSGGFDYR